MSNVESQNIEFKQNWQDEYLKVIAAFANSGGGKLVIGLDDMGKAVILKKIKKLLEDLPNKIRSKLGIIPLVELDKQDDQTIINVTVNPSSVSISYDGKFYIRTGSTIQELKGKELADFILKKSCHSWDEAIEQTTGFDIVNINTIEKFKKYAVDRIPSIIKETDKTTLLQKLNLLDGGYLKKAAILLFGNDPQKYYRQSVLRIGKFLTDAEIQTTDIVKGNLFEQLENTL